jgi:hypothetical protein
VRRKRRVEGRKGRCMREEDQVGCGAKARRVINTRGRLVSL